ncbi:hypothetical protein BAMA_04425 [Bacillus manliponensis]|uniref:Carrier domain-containing protein n=1 Tax=Bacillus manliponensis TaxID=574376 RepID=A0A073JWB1_9BACI|nr:phosphopantetheine-binding protein [Bacillus manliponensis]KEK18521.1 hypothetical protein BAMA_04425 [Bacillus manliponensis]
MKEIKERIINTLVDASEGALDREIIVQVNDDINALSLNSLTIIRWLVNMEDEFDVEFDMEKVVLQDKLIDSFEKLTDYIQNHN